MKQAFLKKQQAAAASVAVPQPTVIPAQTKEKTAGKKESRQSRFLKALKKHKYIYIMMLPVVAYYLIFHFAPMYGMIIAFKDYSVGKGIIGSPWVGFENFKTFFGSYYFVRLLKNTLAINILNILIGFPFPVIFALLLNELRSERFKKSIQTFTYLPHFISVTVLCGMILDFFSTNGIINDLLTVFGLERIPFFTLPEWFRTIYIGTDIWSSFGWGSIIYLAALAGVDISLYEAATIDGAGRFKKMLHVTIPGIMPTVVIMFILKFGHMMSLGAQKILLLYNPKIYETSDVISTFVYRQGLAGAQYSYTTAVDMFSAIINVVLLVSINQISRKVSETSLW